MAETADHDVIVTMVCERLGLNFHGQVGHTLRAVLAESGGAGPADGAGEAMARLSRWVAGHAEGTVNRLSNGCPINLTPGGLESGLSFGDLRALVAASSASGVQEGWRLMPTKLTPKMLDAVRQGCFAANWQFDPEGMYEVLLATAPQPPAADVGTAGMTGLEKTIADHQGYYDEFVRGLTGREPTARPIGDAAEVAA